MFGLGSLLRLSIEATMFSAFLAGVQRSTGISPNLNRIKNKDLRNFVKTYLEFGEYVFDFSVVFFGRSEFFERKR
ncbi:unnamed protein product [Rhizoctonia solani]|uniref:Uncharacterized protein n=1 Tax=Rhizoctonia solani TaxID=456999 RepID=A0A8H2Y678_9AGAM|nr:unnamed protein product [Rhizoctonia solani]CAE6528843.1 unnamed protein product [Rhizoctonia solani]